MAQAPLPQYYRKPYQKLDGGLCTRPNQLTVPANKFIQLDNAILADHDLLEKAQGYILDGTPFSATDPTSFIRMCSEYRVGTSFDSIVVGAHNNMGTAATAGTLTGASGAITDTTAYNTAGANAASIFILINSNSSAGVVHITSITGTTGYQIAASIQSLVVAKGYTGFTCTYNGSAYVLTSGTSGATSSVIVYGYDYVNNNSTSPYNFAYALGLTAGANPHSAPYTGYPTQATVDSVAGFSPSTLMPSASATVVIGTAATVDEATYLVDFKQTIGDGNYYYIGYTVGTALFTNNSTTVTGTGTSWYGQLKAGDKIGVGSIGVSTQPTIWYQIASVNSNGTSITLTAAYAGTTTLTVPYVALIRMNDNYIPVSVVINNNLVITNGSEIPMEWNNTTMSLISAMPKGALVCLHKNRVFTAGVASAPSSIYWSNVNDETTWQSGAVAPVYQQDNGNIVSIVSFANSLIVLKDNGRLYQVLGEFDQSSIGAPIAIRRIDTQDNIGIIAGRTAVVNDDNKLYFLAQTGYYTVTGNYGYMQVDKISWDIQPTIANLIFKSSVATAAQFPYTTQAQWATGTLTGVNTNRFTNSIAPFFDVTSITGVNQSSQLSSVFIDSNNDVHCAWLSADGSTVIYTKWLALDNTQSSQTVVVPATFLNHACTISSIAISVSTSGQVGISCFSQYLEPGSVPQRYLYDLIYIEFVSGTWNAYDAFSINVVPFTGNRTAGSGLSMNYNGTDPRICFALPQAVEGQYALNYLYRSSGTFYNTNISAGLPVTDYFLDVAMTTDSSGNVYIAAVTAPVDYNFGYSVIMYLYSNTGGASFTTPLTSSSLGVAYLTPAGTSPQYGNGKIAIQLDDLSDVIIVYNFNGYSTGDGGNIVRYNVTPHTPVKTTPISSGKLFGYINQAYGAETYYWLNSSNQEVLTYDIIYNVGTATFVSGNAGVTGQGTKWTTWMAPGNVIRVATDSASDYATVLTVNSDTSLTLSSTYSGTSSTAVAYISKSTNTVVNQTSNVVQFMPIGGLSGNGNVLGLGAFSSSTNLISLRRITSFGKFLSPINSNSNLTSWGNFIVSGANASGGSIYYEIGLSESSTILVINTDLITPGTLISNNDANDYAQLTITFQLGSFAQSLVQSAVLNYYALFVDAKLPTGFVFNNEMYVGVTQTANTGNNAILFLDRRHAWMDFLIGVTSFARMEANQTLYAGSSTNGTVYRLRSGYDMAGSAYNMVAVTKEDMLGSLELFKDVYKVYAQYIPQASGSFTFSYRLNYYQNSQAPWVTFNINQQNGAVTDNSGNSYESTIPGLAEIPIHQPCSSIQFMISQSGADVQCQFVGFTVLYQYLNLR